MQSRSTNNIKGIDVSHWQGKINWTKVAVAGIKFVYIKATEGATFVDPRMDENYRGAKAAGLKVGFYHFATPGRGNDYALESKHYIKTVKNYKVDLPHVLDIEVTNGLKAVELTRFAKSWLETVQAALGPVMIYTGASFAKTYLGKELGKYPLWVAHYGVNTPMANNTWSRWACFQYSQEGRIAGINERVDLDEMDRDFYYSVVKSAPAPSKTTTPPKKTTTPPKKTNNIPIVGYIKIVNVKKAAYICDRPSKQSRNLDIAPLGSKWPIAGSVPGWWEIIYKGQRAYVNAKFGRRVK